MWQFAKFWGGALWASLSFGWVVFGVVSTALPALFTIIVRYWKRASKIGWIQWASEHQAELHVAVAGFCILAYLVYAPFGAWTSERTAKEAAQKETKTLKTEVAQLKAAKPTQYLLQKDPEAQQKLTAQAFQIEDLQSKLREKNDPFAKPLTMAKFTIRLNFKELKGSRGNNLGAGAAVLFVTSDNRVLIYGSGIENHSDGEGHSRVVFDAPVDAPAMGKPIRSLLETQTIVLQFALGLVPLDTEISDGLLILVLNNEVSLAFKIPPQKVTGKIEKTEAQPDEGTWINLTDIREGLSPMAMPPSPTPSTAALPP